MLFAVIIISVSSLIAVTLALTWSILGMEPKANQIPLVFVGLGLGGTFLGLLYARIKMGRWPSVGQPDDGKLAMPVSNPDGQHQNKTEE